MKCKNCGREIDYKKYKRGKRKSFCDSNCYENFRKEKNKANSRRRYESKKNDPAFQKKNQERFQRWYKVNKEYHKTYMRDYMRDRQRIQYHERREAGLCTRCGKNYTSMADCDECKSRRKWK